MPFSAIFFVSLGGEVYEGVLKKRGHSQRRMRMWGCKERKMEGLGFDVNFPFFGLLRGFISSIAKCVARNFFSPVVLVLCDLVSLQPSSVFSCLQKFTPSCSVTKKDLTP